MHNFTGKVKCSECGSDQFQIFADLEGNGIKCADCLHKAYIFKPKKGEAKIEKRKRMNEAWKRANKKRTF